MGISGRILLLTPNPSLLARDVLHIRLVAQLAYPLVVALVRFACVDLLSRRRIEPFLAHVAFAPLEDLNQVQAEGRPHGRGKLPGFERLHGLLEFRHELPRADPAELAAARRRAGVLGVGACQAREVLALLDAALER